MSVERLGYLGFAVKDVPAWRRFLGQQLGLMEAPAQPDAICFRMDARAWRIAVHEGQDDDLAYAGYEVASEAAMHTMADTLRKAGVEVQVGSEALARKRKVLGLIEFADPFGLPLEIYYGGSDVSDQPFVASAGVSGFLTGDQGIGHFVRIVADAQVALRFYTEVLGFRLTDVIDMTLAPGVVIPTYFLHCNGRHHTLALAAFPVPKRIHHFMLEVNSLDDVGYAFDRLGGDNCLTTTIGRHSNDQMVSFYCSSPSGVEVEFGWGARVVDAAWSVARHDVASMWGHKPLRAPG